MERILITGGSGFIGTNLVEKLRHGPNEIISTDVIEPKDARHRAIWERLDITDEENVFDIFRRFRPSQVYHLGARTDLASDNVGDYLANTRGVAHIAKAAGEFSVKRVIFCSSRLVCRIGYQPKSDTDYCPTTAYGESKVIGENIVRRLGATTFDWAIVRPTSIWGPWFDVPYRQFFDSVRGRKYVHPGNRVVKKSFGYVGNSVFQLEALMACDAARFAQKTFYIGDYEPIELRDFATRISTAFGGRGVFRLPVSALMMVALAGDTLKRLGYRNPALTTFRLNNLLMPMLHDFRNLEAITGALPYSLEEGIRQTVDWMRSHEPRAEQ